MSDLHWEQAGEGSPVVLIHAGIADGRMWDPQWETYAEQHRVVRLDLRGFGSSPAPKGKFSLAEDLVELLDELALGPASLVGASMGGAVAMEATIARPDLVSALVLVAPGLRGHEFSEETQAGWAEEEKAFERGDLEEFVEVNLRMWVDGPTRSPEDVDPGLRRRVGEMQARAFELWREAGEDGEQEPLVPDWAERLGEIGVLTLVIVGDLDRPEMREISERLESEIPNVRRETIVGTAHVPSMERPEEFDRLVREFLR